MPLTLSAQLASVASLRALTVAAEKGAMIALMKSCNADWDAESLRQYPFLYGSQFLKISR